LIDSENYLCFTESKVEPEKSTEFKALDVKCGFGQRFKVGTNDFLLKVLVKL